jgi:hypothetical protein
VNFYNLNIQDVTVIVDIVSGRDPLSPIQFNLVVDVLNRMLSKASHAGLVKGLLGEFKPGGCRSGFTTLPPVSLLEQYRCGSFVGGAQIARGVGYPGIRWTRRFTWFGSPERNTLRPRVKGVVLLCLSARLRSSPFSPSVRASV